MAEVETEGAGAVAGDENGDSGNNIDLVTAGLQEERDRNDLSASSETSPKEDASTMSVISDVFELSPKVETSKPSRNSKTETQPKDNVPPPPPSAATPKSSIAQSPHPLASPASGNAQMDMIREQLLELSKSGKIDKIEAQSLSILIKDYDGLKDKVAKIKSLLGRSAKAQREAKVELEVTQKRLDQALREVDRLQSKIDKLANRPTHMELLADFETNFDRALLSMNHTSSSNMEQSGGQDTAPPHSIYSEKEVNVMDTLLTQELNEAKARIEKLESLNSNLLQRSNMLDEASKQSKRERDELQMQVKHLELEKRMAVMEAEHATKAMQATTASLAEMQMEIDLVTKASVSANARAAQGEELVKNVKTDRQHVMEMEAKVAALQEWALAANEAKMLAQERVRLLETQLRSLQNSHLGGGGTDGSAERVLFSIPGSLVIGAGDRGCHVVELSADDVTSVKRSERVILRWRFDLVQDDAEIEFSILKSKCETKQKQKNADYLIKDRAVVGGAAGESENAFAIQNSCTLLWCNSKAWIRPKTVRFNIEAVAIED
jgi:hypothetical protein